MTASLVDELCASVRAERVDPGELADRLQHHLDRRAPLLTDAERLGVRQRALAQLVGLGALEPFLHDPAVTDVVVNGGRDVWVDRGAGMQQVATLGVHEVDAIVERVIAPLGLRFDRTHPVVDARLPDGARLSAVLAPLAVDGTCLSIRRFAVRDVALTDFAGSEVAGLLETLVQRRLNLLVSGATSTGKTTLLNALGTCIGPGERVITIEDTAELRLRSAHVVRLEARPATPEGLEAVTLRDLVRAALRLRPDRLVIGEVRGPEALEVVHALNTGHDGSLATIHANSPADALRRLTSLALLGAPGHTGAAVAEQAAASVDVVVHVARTASGHRVVSEVAEVRAPGGDGPLTVPLALGDRVLGHPSRARSGGTAP